MPSAASALGLQPCRALGTRVLTRESRPGPAALLREMVSRQAPPPRRTYEGSPACLTCALSSLRLLRAHQRGRLGMGQRLLRSRSQWHKDLLHRQTRPFTDHASSRERAQIGTSHFAAKELLQLPDITAPQNELARGSGPAWESGGWGHLRAVQSGHGPSLQTWGGERQKQPQARCREVSFHWAVTTVL